MEPVPFAGRCTLADVPQLSPHQEPPLGAGADLLTAPVLAVILTVGSDVMARVLKQGLKVSSTPGAIYAALAGLVLLQVVPMTYNCFGRDLSGFQRWGLAPIELRRVLLAKNLALFVAAGLNFAFVSLLAAAQQGPSASVGTVAAAFTAALLVMTGAGNFFSAWWPKRVAFDTMSSKMVSEAAVLLGMAVQACMALFLWALAAAARYSERPWLWPAGLMVFLLAAALAYRDSLERAARHVRAHAEDLTRELG